MTNTSVMTQRIFEHVGCDLGYEDLVATTTEKGRVYVTPSGQKYPSITTVLGHFGKQAIFEWRQTIAVHLILRHILSRN